MKCVILINSKLPKGQAANTCAVIGMSFGKLFPEVIGHDLFDQESNLHRGITSKPVPVLKTGNDILLLTYRRLCNEHPDIVTIPFSETAAKSRSYTEYEQRLSQTESKELTLYGLGIYGNADIVANYTSELKLF